MKQGDRIRVHPASDWFMRGETHATVAFIRRNGVIRVIGELSGKRFWLVARNVLEVNGVPTEPVNACL